MIKEVENKEEVSVPTDKVEEGVHCGNDLSYVNEDDEDKGNDLHKYTP